jgi:hypothetical protein
VYTEGVTSQKRLPRFRRAKTRPFQFQDRDYEIVRAVGLHQVVQSTHIDRLFPDGSPDNLRRRLYHLFHKGYLTRPRAQAGELVYHEGSSHMVYMLAPKGAELVMEREGLRLPIKADRELAQLKHALLVTDFMIAMHETCEQSEFLRLVPQHEILAQAPAATRADRRPTTWRIDVDYRGSRRTLHLEPDGIFAVAHSQLAAPQDRKFFFLEIDRGTMPVVRSSVEQTSILRKLAAYHATFRAGTHRSRFGIDNMRVLIVGKSRERTATIIDAFQEHLGGKVSPRIFLAADRPALFQSARGLHLASWVDMEGKARALFE